MIVAYSTEREREHESQKLLGVLHNRQTAYGEGQAKGVGQQRREAMANMKWAEKKFAKVKALYSVEPAVLDTARSELLAAQQKLEELTRKVGAGKSCDGTSLPASRIRGISGRVALRLAGVKLHDEKCAFCNSTKLLVCYSCSRSICTEHCNYIGGGKSATASDGQERRLGGAHATCIDYEACYKQQRDNDRALAPVALRRR